MELYRKHRPKKFSDIVGNKIAVAQIRKMIEGNTIPHLILLSGPSGCGKTTIARILRKPLHCSMEYFNDTNAAQQTGIDLPRLIHQTLHARPLSGRVVIWLIDECHRLTKPAQSAFLKMMEDTPSWVYFILATTEPQALLPTIRTRATHIKVNPLNSADMDELLIRVAEVERITFGQKVMSKIKELSNGSPRQALVHLEQVSRFESESDQLETLLPSDLESKSYQLAKALLNQADWNPIASILKTMKNEDVEMIRFFVLAYMNTVLLGGGKKALRAYAVIHGFRNTFWNSKQAGLTAACYEVFNV